MSQRLPWLRVVSEGVAIVVSILLAFGIQAWWDARQEREEGHEALQQIEAEFVALDSLLVQWEGYHRSVMSACDVLLAHAGPRGSNALSEDSLASLIGAMKVTYTFDATLANVDALKASGQVTTIRNNEVLAELSRFDGLLADLRGDEDATREIILNHLTPYLYDNFPFAVTPYDTPVYSNAAGRSAFSYDLSAVLESKVFENIVADIMQRAANSAGNYIAARAATARILDLVRKELADG